jgi:hypothetical protein
MVLILSLLGLGFIPQTVGAAPIHFEVGVLETWLTIDVTQYDGSNWKHQYTFSPLTGETPETTWVITWLTVSWGVGQGLIEPVGYGFDDGRYAETGTTLTSALLTTILDTGSNAFSTRVTPTSPLGFDDTIESFYIVYPEPQKWQLIRLTGEGYDSPLTQDNAYQKATYDSTDFSASIPEPSALLLITGALVMLGLLSQQRKKTHS